MCKMLVGYLYLAMETGQINPENQQTVLNQFFESMFPKQCKPNYQKLLAIDPTNC